MLLKFSELIYPLYFSLFKKNKNALAIEYYIGAGSLLFCLILSVLSYSIGRLYIEVNANITFYYLILNLISALCFFIFIVIIETAIIKFFSKIIGLSARLKILLKTIALSYFPLIFFAPAIIFYNVLGFNIFWILLVCWIIILKLHYLKIVFNIGYFKSFILLMSPIIYLISLVFFIFLFFLILIFAVVTI